ncbi:MAG TPA: hypothetical protein VGW34_11305 [Allosphingosinicella sp.]|nr:hypothetical protein [Allosphingosinicella sp.]
MVLETRLRKAWGKMREAGGSIIGHTGENLTGKTYSQFDFAKYMNELCASDPELIQAALDTIDKAIEEGAWFADMNKQRFTTPKCHSKPIVTMRIGCRIDYHFDKRHGGEEEDCSG